MEVIRYERLDNILAIRMARAKANALNLSMVGELCNAVDQAAADPGVRGVALLSDCPGFYSAGFDVSEVFGYDRDSMTLLSARFIDLYEGLYLLPKPVVAAISGHAYGAGAMLASACDLRIMSTNGADFALNEINLGIIHPPGFIRMLVGAVGPGAAREIIFLGNPVPPERALEIGLVCELAEPEVLQRRAIEACAALARKPEAAFAANKQSLREVLGRTALDSDRIYLQQIIDRWFSPEVTALRQSLRDSMNSKK